MIAATEVAPRLLPLKRLQPSQPSRGFSREPESAS
jgi:hypothetical protein